MLTCMQEGHEGKSMHYYAIKPCESLDVIQLAKLAYD